MRCAHSPGTTPLASCGWPLVAFQTQSLVPAWSPRLSDATEDSWVLPEERSVKLDAAMPEMEERDLAFNRDGSCLWETRGMASGTTLATYSGRDGLPKTKWESKQGFETWPGRSLLNAQGTHLDFLQPFSRVQFEEGISLPIISTLELDTRVRAAGVRCMNFSSVGDQEYCAIGEGFEVFGIDAKSSSILRFRMEDLETEEARNLRVEGLAVARGGDLLILAEADLATTQRFLLCVSAVSWRLVWRCALGDLGFLVVGSRDQVAIHVAIETDQVFVVSPDTVLTASFDILRRHSSTLLSPDKPSVVATAIAS